MNRGNVPNNDEQVFLDAGNVFVSSTRAVLFGETYAVSNITSVRKSVIRISLRAIITRIIGSGILAFIAAFIVTGIFWWMLSQTAGAFFGLITFVAVFAFVAYRSCYLHSKNPDCVLHIGTAGGETDGLVSKDEIFVDQVAEAINAAIIARG